MWPFQSWLFNWGPIAARRRVGTAEVSVVPISCRVGTCSACKPFLRRPRGYRSGRLRRCLRRTSGEARLVSSGLSGLVSRRRVRSIGLLRCIPWGFRSRIFWGDVDPSPFDGRVARGLTPVVRWRCRAREILRGWGDYFDRWSPFRSVHGGGVSPGFGVARLLCVPFWCGVVVGGGENYSLLQDTSGLGVEVYTAVGNGVVLDVVFWGPWFYRFAPFSHGSVVGTGGGGCGGRVCQAH